MFWNIYILKHLRLETIMFSDATLCYATFCHSTGYCVTTIKHQDTYILQENLHSHLENSRKIFLLVKMSM